MRENADLELWLQRWPTGAYALGVRYSPPHSDAEVELMRGQRPVAFDFARLGALSLDAEAYGQLLGANLLADPDAREAFGRARREAQADDVPLRLRLFIDPTATELHGLRWETLRDPTDGTNLLASEWVLFSRYLSSPDAKPVLPRPRGEVSALVVIADPSDLASFEVERQPLEPSDAPTLAGRRRLARLDVAGEQARALAALEPMPTTVVASGGAATLSNLVRQLRLGHDILYLVCHGALIGGEPRLWLEDESGKSAVVAGRELVEELSELQKRPRLVVLASCQSAGSGDDARSDDEGVLAALGPRLAEAGIPAVVAMQGSVTMATVAGFMPAFFESLRRDGQVDLAMSAGRGAVAGRHDAWMPVLFMRMKSGRVWSGPGVARAQPAFDKWRPLLEYVLEGACTPILGPGLIESSLVSRREMARSWATDSDFPLSPHQLEELPQVAQFLAVSLADNIPRRDFVKYVREKIRRRYGDDLPPDLRDGEPPIDELVAAVGATLRQRDPTEPHRVLASLPLPLYITANPDNLLEMALAEAGKEPRFELCRWNRFVESLPSVFDDQPGYRPTRNRPLVYHLFGHVAWPRSLVLTEDDYFDYLIGVTGNKELIPSVVRTALADSALLFLGFEMNDWNFRVLFRSIMASEGAFRRGGYTHVAVQIDPDASRILEPEGARRYLERYFGKGDISIYWGSAEQFIAELQRRLGVAV